MQQERVFQIVEKLLCCIIINPGREWESVREKIKLRIKKREKKRKEKKGIEKQKNLEYILKIQLLSSFFKMY